MTLVKVEVIMMFREIEHNPYDELRNIYFTVGDDYAAFLETNCLDEDWLEEDKRFIARINKAVHEMPDYSDYNNWCIGNITTEGRFSTRQGRTIFKS